MIAVDIIADLNAEDGTGYVWTFLDEARDPSLITPGAIDNYLALARRVAAGT